MPLLPIQQYFFANENDINHYNHAVLLVAPDDLSPIILEKFTELLIQRHDSLRLRFNLKNDQWVASHLPFSAQMISEVMGEIKLDIHGFSELEEKANSFQRSLSIKEGPIFRVIHCSDLGGKVGILFIVHHLVIDGVSWRVIFEDLEQLYEQYSYGKSLALQAKTSSYKIWSEFLVNHAKNDELLNESKYWLKTLNYPKSDILNKQKSNKTKIDASNHYDCQTFVISENKTSMLLSIANEAYKTQINELLLSALLLGCNNWTGGQSIQVDLESHGRQELVADIDLSQTVGWFSSLYPVNLKCQFKDIKSVICAVKEQYRSVPNQGIGFGILKYLSEAPGINGAELSPMLFNYMGQFSNTESDNKYFSLSHENIGDMVGSSRHPEHGLNFNGIVKEGCLSFRLDYDQTLYDSSSISNLVELIESAFEQLLMHCLDQSNGCLTPSDFPMSVLSQKEIDKWQKEYLIEDIYPATAMQEGLLYHSELNKSAYVTQSMFTINSDVSLPLFKKAWQHLIDSYAVLRTIFVNSEAGQIQQLVLQETNLRWLEDDLELLDKTEIDKKIDMFRLQERSMGFELNKGPLLRLNSWHLGKGCHRILLSIHHALIDGWSMPLAFTQVIKYYRTIAENTRLTLESTVPYRNYVKWLGNQNIDLATDFWANELCDIEQPSLIAGKKNNKEKKRVFHSLKFEKELTEALQLLARRNQVTINNLLQAAWAYLIHCYTDQNVVMYGTTVSGRPEDLNRVDEMIGLFINTIPVRVDIPLHQSFEHWLKSLHTRQIERNDFAFLPLPKIKQVTQLDNSQLFDNLFVFENYPVDKSALESTDIKTFDHLTFEETDYELTVTAHLKDMLTVDFMGKYSHFSINSLKQLAEHFKEILNNILKKPEQKLKDLSMLSQSEKHHQIHGLNVTGRAYQTDQCIHHLFEEQVLLTPDGVAVAEEDNCLSYSELNARANRLAHYLIKHENLKADEFVGLCMDRSLDMIIGLMAILKAGAAYLPLDPSYPKERLLYMIQDSGLSLVITRKELSEITQSKDTEQLFLDSDSLLTDLSIFSADNPAIESNSSDHLAYAIYTSGSTGKPKGVMIEHRALSNLCQWHIEQYEVNHESTASHLASIGFDAAVWELWPYLISGSRVQIISDEIRISPDTLLSQFKLYKVSHSFIPTALLEASFDLINDSSAHDLKYVLTGGDRLTRPSFTHSQTQLVNNYGPTESTVVACCYVTKTAAKQSPPIGKPIANTRAYVLSKRMVLMPYGSVGELYIAGDGLARGYINDPQLTSKYFIEHTFADGTSERLYRTGDLVKYREDGNLNFIGRADDQIKIRGYRIELGEIEQQLLSLSEVNSCVVVVRSGRLSEKRIVAYYVSDSKTEESELVSTVQTKLKRKLPDYMLPKSYVRLDKIPETVNGKIDRKALPAPLTHEQTDGFKAPSTEVEIKLCEIWSGLLKIQQGELSIRSNFFELGGDSILSIQVASRASAVGLKVTVKQIFDHQTIESLAPHVVSSELIAPQEAVTGSMPLLPIHHRFFTDDTALHHFNQSVLLKPPQGFSFDLLQRFVEKLYKRHDALRLNYQLVKDKWVANHVDFNQQMVTDTLAEVRFNDVGFDGLEDSASEYQTSLDLELGQLFKVVYYSDKNDESRILLIFHHLVIDGVSWRVILEDLELLYEQHSAGKALKLGAKTSSYKSWGRFLHEYSNSDSLGTQLDYWKQVLSVPTPDFNKGSIELSPKSEQTLNGFSSVEFEINKKLTTQLLSETQGAYRTQINELLLSALLIGFNRWSGVNSLRVDLESHGREELSKDINLNQTIGWFTTLFPVALKCESIDIKSVICAVKEQHRAIPSHGIGFGVLKYLAKVEDLNKAEESPILFNYMGQFFGAKSSTQRFSFADEGMGLLIDPYRQPEHGLNFNGMILDDRLSFILSYDQTKYNAVSMKELHIYIKQAIKDVIEHCIDVSEKFLTPSDFPLSSINHIELNRWQKMYNIKDLYPTTTMQDGLLYHSELDKSAYVTQSMYTLEKGADIALFKQCWQTLIDRHDILRTIFIDTNAGEKQQLVVSKMILLWSEYNLEKLNEEQQKNQIENERRQDKAAGFDFKNGPLFRLMIWQIGGGRYRVLFSIHHTLIDGWSMPLIYSEILQLYQAGIENKHIKLKQSVPYRNYVEWLCQQDFDRATKFWSQELSGLNDGSSLFSENKNDKNKNLLVQNINLNSDYTTILKNIARNSQVTVSTLLQAAWSILLARYCDQSSVVFGTTVSGRPADLEKVEEIIGLFINTIPVRVDMVTDIPFNEWLKHLHIKQVERNEYAYLPLVEIQSLSETENRHLFDHLFIFENYPIDEEEFKGSVLQTSDHKNYEETSFNLTVTAFENNGLTIKFAGKESNFDKSSLQTLVSHYKNILSGIIERPNQMISRLPLQSEGELNYLLSELNQSRKQYSNDLCIQDLFENQVNLSPNKAAIIFDGNSLSYSELNSHANRLAHFLIDHREHSIQGGEFLIGIYFERSLDMLVAILAVLKAGGAYVPLDPEYPQERLSYMINNSNLDVLLCQNNLFESIDNLGCKQILFDEQFKDQLSSYSINNPKNTCLSSKDLAYVIYTSGSTGRPKGVMIEHHSVINLSHNINDLSLSDDRQKWGWISSFAFDASLQGIVMMLHGQTLQIFSEKDKKDINAIKNELIKNEIGVMDCTPTLLELWLSTGLGELLPNLIIGGEAISYALWEKLVNWQEQYGKKAINVYGPTECCVDSSASVIKGTKPNIGKALNNYQFYVLDKSKKLSPLGVKGELYIGGSGLARGYLNEPEQTKERFIINPFIPDKEELLYQTGDLVRYIDNGNLEFLGRIDEQVKIRGYRIELGEIEHVLSKQENISSCAVIVHSSLSEEKYIVAYFVSEGNLKEAELIEDLKVKLKKVLPNYMIPSRFIQMESLPKTPNGKINRKKLPEPDTSLMKDDYKAPKGETELALVKIWSELLVIPIEEIGANSNFFELGGHSLLAVKMIVKINHKFPILLKVETLFESQNLSMLASYIDMLMVNEKDRNQEIECNTEESDTEHFEI